jgi:cell division protein FtsQ
MPVAAPSDKRFRRARVRPTRRRRMAAGRGWQLARATVAVALALYGVYRGAQLVLSAEALRVTRITVTGNTRLSKGEVMALVDGLRGQSMVTADLEVWRHKLMASPWVGAVAMRRVFPGTIAVAIAERQPMGIGRLGRDLYLIDHEGTVIDQFGPNYAELDLPIIDGLGGPPRDGAALVDEERAALAARLLASLEARPDLANRVSQIDVRDARDAAVVLKDDTALLRLGDDQFTERLQSYLDLAPALRERVDGIDYVDLRFDDRIYIKPHLRPDASGVRRQVKGREARGEGRAGKEKRRGARSQKRRRTLNQDQGARGWED